MAFLTMQQLVREHNIAFARGEKSFEMEINHLADLVRPLVHLQSSLFSRWTNIVVAMATGECSAIDDRSNPVDSFARFIPGARIESIGATMAM